jgi:hypothetical protein
MPTARNQNHERNTKARQHKHTNKQEHKHTNKHTNTPAAFDNAQSLAPVGSAPTTMVDGETPGQLAWDKKNTGRCKQLQWGEVT